ncbi:uncharacterized protein LOC120443244 [Oreochromis aureus]|uniref:uncharacterized protein LOC120443244 n=1 Tax=Oreochromis aureus TaxID=47969 RepID=UPI001953240D|nr:uncharacterized protein LOC120443244 [Oreochromis aureus]
MTQERDDMETEEANKQGKQEWLERVKREFQNGPLASNVVFALILTVLERLVETEFECPCKGTYLNGGFVATFFIIPGILAFVLMASMQELKCSRDTDNAKRFFHCCVPAFVWMILMLFDGSYFSCGMTDWSGRYVTADKAAPLKWCEPENGTSYHDRLNKSQDWYFLSQWAGLALVLALVFLIIKCIINTSLEQEQSSPPSESDSGPCVPPDQAFGSGSAVALRPLHTNTPDTNVTDM